MTVESPIEKAIRPSVGLLGWYSVCASKLLKENELYHLSMFNEPLVIYRDKNNKPRCIKDSCPHRSASFRGGENQNGEIVCPYHGARYTTSCNQDGSDRITCNHIIDSHYDNFAKHLHLKQYPCVEQGDYIYIYYTGEAQPSPKDFQIKSHLENSLPEAYGFDLKDYEYEEVFIDFKCDWSRIIENHLDILHIFWLHGNTLPGNDVNRKTIKSFNQSINKDQYHLRSVYHEKENNKDEFISQIFIPPGRVIIFKGATEQARYVQVLDHIPLSHNRARIIVRHYRKFLRNKLLCKLLLFKQRQQKVFYKIFSEDYLVLQTQTFNEQMGYLNQGQAKLLAEDKMINLFWDWHQHSLEKEHPWDIHPTTAHTNTIHQDMLMLYPPANPQLSHDIKRIIDRKVAVRLFSIILIILALIFAPDLVQQIKSGNVSMPMVGTQE